jgi:creatinine amidohydrolase
MKGGSAVHDLPEVRWDFLLPKEFGERVAACPVCYMPLGTLERHGSHLPFGQDGLKAYGLCLRAAQAYGGVVLPPLHWGTHGWWAEEYRAGLPGERLDRRQPQGSVYIHEGLLMSLLHSMFREVEHAGCKVVVALTGHYPAVQVQAVKSAAAQYMVSSPVRIWALCEPELSGEVEVGSDHAGKWETSLFWAMYPDYVKIERCPDPDTGEFLWSSKEALAASPQLGQTLVEYIVSKLGEGASKLLETYDVQC